jgi:hypothetical protein
MAENKIDPKFNIHSNYTKVNILNPYRFAVGASYEPETLNYMAAVGIADDSTVYYAGTPQEITGNGFYLAIDTFVKSLKTEGIFSKLKAVYPFIGGTADRHKWNLMNPQDTNAAHRMLWYGSGTHSETGFKGDGSTAYGDTNLPHNTLSLGNESFGVYSRTDITATFIDIASDLNSTLYLKWSNGLLYTRSQTTTIKVLSNDNSLGFFALSRKHLDRYKLQNKGIFTEFFTDASTINSSNFFLGKSSIGYNSGREYPYAFIGEGLIETEMTAHYNAVQQLQTDLGRAV